MTDKVRKIATVVLLVIFAGSTIMMIRQNSNYRQADFSYKEAEELAKVSQGTEIATTNVAKTIVSREKIQETESEPATKAKEESLIWTPVCVEKDSTMDELEQIDLLALQEVNSDVIGWIHIPGTVIDYPLLQGKDNHYYLKHTWDNKENAAGAIFMESTNTPDFSDFHTIIYGHNMKSKTMFSAIKNYREESYWREHPYIYVVTKQGVYRYEVYASYEAGVTSDTYRLGFKEEGKKVFLEIGEDQSVIETGIKPETTDRILTLSTCTGSGHETRWVVQAYLKMEIANQEL